MKKDCLDKLNKTEIIIYNIFKNYSYSQMNQNIYIDKK